MEMFSKNSKAIIYNLKPVFIQSILDFDYVCGNKPSIAAIVHNRKGFHKAFYGNKEILIPVYDSMEEALDKGDVLINFASYRSVYEPMVKALNSETIKTAVIIAEGVPERQMKNLIAIAKKNNKYLIGPATVGALKAGCFKAGVAGGTAENIIRAKLYRSGSVGLVTKSGGLLNEMFNIISKTTNGVYEGVAVGGDVFTGTTLYDHVLRYQNIPDVKMIVVLGEIGGKEEYKIVEAKKKGLITKPIVAWVSGTCAKMFSWDVQFGHASAKAGKKGESAEEKNEALREAGIIVPNSFNDLPKAIQKTFNELKAKGLIPEVKEKKPNPIPMDLKTAIKKGIVRVPTNLVCSVSRQKDEIYYRHLPLSSVVKQRFAIGKTIGLLWFGKEVPDYFAEFIEKVIVLLAEHGQEVSASHNAVVASRAGKDIISCLCSGLLTVGPRFGGAISSAAKYFKQACDSNKNPYDFVEDMKAKGIRIPGIGHRIKSKRNPDKRVELLKAFAKQHFPSTKYLDYALEVEKITLKKSEKLILNVDGCVAALLLDGLTSFMSNEEVEQLIETECFNALFALARSIGIVAHSIDQKMLKQPLYRHPSEDVFYLNQK